MHACWARCLLMQAKHAKESCSKSIRRRVLTGLERLPVIRIIVDHLGKEGMAPHADLLLLSPHTKPHSHATIIYGPTTNIHAYPASHLCRRATAHRLDLVSALLPSRACRPRAVLHSRRGNTVDTWQAFDVSTRAPNRWISKRQTRVMSQTSKED